ncbi:MAG: hypothetical protein NUV94_07540 [Candidatus Acetothermia bacterium]|nr:hypothetical protein [Candidatus Acetothermia bacterium]
MRTVRPPGNRAGPLAAARDGRPPGAGVSCPATMRQALETLVNLHVRRYPGFGAQDLAKLLYQGALGMDHLLGDPARFLAALRKEWETLEPIPPPAEPLLEPVDPRGRTHRVNLRPAKAAGIELTELGTLLVNQPRKEGRFVEFERWWWMVVELAEAGRIAVPPPDLRALAGCFRPDGPPPDHSPRYRQLHRPAYRLVHDVADPGVQAVRHPLGYWDGSLTMISGRPHKRPVRLPRTRRSSTGAPGWASR